MLGQYAKAVVAFIVAALGSLQVALLDSHISGVEWISIVATGLAALGLVWGVPNSGTFAQLPTTRYRPVSPDEQGK